MIGESSPPPEPTEQGTNAAYTELESPQNQTEEEEEIIDPYSTQITEAPTEGEPENAVNKVKTSASRLATSFGLLTKDIDSKLGISFTAKKIDDKIHVTDKTKQAFHMVATTATNIDQKYHVSEKTRNTASAVGSSATAQGLKNRMEGVFQGAGAGLKNFDEKHRVSTNTANFFSSTTDFITGKIHPKGSGSNERVVVPDPTLAEAMKERDDGHC